MEHLLIFNDLTMLLVFLLDLLFLNTYLPIALVQYENFVSKMVIFHLKYSYRDKVHDLPTRKKEKILF